jgi:hypothetical protein
MEPRGVAGRIGIMKIAAVMIAAAALLAVPAAVAKELRPGDLLVCGRTACVPIMNRSVVRVLGSYYYGPRRVVRAGPVRRGAPGFELRFTNGYASGMIATTWLNRFRGYGFFCGRFVRGRWYRFPPRAVDEIRRLTAGLQPLRVSAAPRSC